MIMNDDNNILGAWKAMKFFLIGLIMIIMKNVLINGHRPQSDFGIALNLYTAFLKTSNLFKLNRLVGRFHHLRFAEYFPFFGFLKLTILNALHLYNQIFKDLYKFSLKMSDPNLLPLVE